MKPCHACAEPERHLYVTGCRDCAIRDLARGPLFWAQIGKPKLSPGYIAELRKLGDPREVHEEVKAVAKTICVGSIPA